MTLEPMKVEELIVNGCEELVSLWQSEWGWLVPLRSLRNLNLENYSQVVSIGARKEEEKVEVLQLDIPFNIEHLRIRHCEVFEKLSVTLHNLTCLRELKIEMCPKVVSLLLDNLPSTLQRLVIGNCENLLCLLEDGESINFRRTSVLESLEINGYKALKSLSSSGKLPLGLKEVMIEACLGLESIALNIGDNNCLEIIQISSCEIMQYLPQGLDKLRSLQSLEVYHCPNLVRFPESLLPNTNLQRLILDGCEKLEALPNLCSPQLQILQIRGCPRLTSIPEEGLPSSLTNLLLEGPNVTKAIIEWGLHRLISLKGLSIDGGKYTDVVSFPQGMNIRLPFSLNYIRIENFKSLRKLSFKGIQYLSSLQYLSIADCPRLKSLPKREIPSSLLELRIYNCPVLKKKCKRDKGKSWSKIAHIPSVFVDGEFIS